VPEELAESAFFGSRKGAYTGSSSDRKGYFEAASGGTLFLDEVGETSLSLQAALLRAVETGEIQSVGAESSRRADARIVAATNRDLREEISGGRFREDLFWRLAQAQVALSPLADRRGEIRGLAAFLAAPMRAQMGALAPELGEGALGYLEARPWPGNVRELRAFLERALWLAPQGSRIDAAYLAGLEQGPRASALRSPAAREAGASMPAAAAKSLAEAKEDFERAYVAAALAEADGSVARAAELLGLLPNNLSRKIKELGLR
jgi:transcriptional regulator with GAF, ATPase, and Fis domain